MDINIGKHGSDMYAAFRYIITSDASYSETYASEANFLSHRKIIFYRL